VAATYQPMRFPKPLYNGKRAADGQYQKRVGSLAPPGTLHYGPSFPRRWGRFFWCSGRVRPTRWRLKETADSGGIGISFVVRRSILGRKAMGWFSGKTAIGGSQISNWVLVLLAVVVIWVIYAFAVR
jgi:hypothetical protein